MLVLLELSFSPDKSSDTPGKYRIYLGKIPKRYSEHVSAPTPETKRGWPDNFDDPS